MLIKFFISGFFIFSFFFVSAQDVSAKKSDSTYTTHTYKNKRKIKSTKPNKKKIYRDTRLGSSSPMYNTYKKNDNGAGAVTTNPNKGGGSSSPIIVEKQAQDTLNKQ